jgi:hypothetical protein
MCCRYYTKTKAQATSVPHHSPQRNKSNDTAIASSADVVTHMRARLRICVCSMCVCECEREQASCAYGSTALSGRVMPASYVK